MWKKAALTTLALIGIAWLAAEMFFTSYVTSPRESRERILQNDMFEMREILSQYTLDNHKRPQSLNDLVTAGYLKEVPPDPITGGTTHGFWSGPTTRRCPALSASAAARVDPNSRRVRHAD